MNVHDGHAEFQDRLTKDEGITGRTHQSVGTELVDTVSQLVDVVGAGAFEIGRPRGNRFAFWVDDNVDRCAHRGGMTCGTPQQSSRADQNHENFPSPAVFEPN